MRPHQGEKCQVADHVGQNGRKRRVGEIRRRAKRNAHKKVHQKLRPQDAMSEVCEGKHEGGDGDRDPTANLPFEGDLKISAKPNLLHEWRNQGPHQNNEGYSHAGIARHIWECVGWHLDQSEQHDPVSSQPRIEHLQRMTTGRSEQIFCWPASSGIAHRMYSVAIPFHPDSSTSATAEESSRERTSVPQGCSEDW
ncbi:hypothetical protein HDF12_000664 [Edaphobacter lichenicola]|uniref:Uncharacterized protein n=1 Tax=Tunturiibacter lichenicola TaxID=2051959 RepID=A0A7Y9NJ73_9BACT|nr:hypothetical protein [Edaphobacter lichenicola]